jgi:hypothetical protein
MVSGLGVDVPISPTVKSLNDGGGVSTHWWVHTPSRGLTAALTSRGRHHLVLTHPAAGALIWSGRWCRRHDERKEWERMKCG